MADLIDTSYGAAIVANGKNAAGQTMKVLVPAFTLRNEDGSARSGGPYDLAVNVPIAANTGTTPVTGVSGDVYVWDAQFTGTGPLKLQALGADGVTWRDVASLSASGTLQGEIRLGKNATVRLFSTTALTAVYSRLS